MPGPVQAGMIREDLNARADDENHQEKVEEVLPAHPGRKACCWPRTRWHDRPGVLPDEPLYGWFTAQPLSDGDRHDEEHEANGEQPQQVEPFAASDANPGGNAVGLWDRARPGGGVDDVLAGGQLPPVASDTVRRDVRRSRSWQVSGRGDDLVAHAVKPTPGDTNPRTVNLSSCPPPLRADMRRGPCCTRSRDCRDSIGERDAGERQAAAGAGLPRRWALVGSVESRSVGLGSLARAVGPPSPPRNPIRHLSGH